jgi:putative protease
MAKTKKKKVIKKKKIAPKKKAVLKKKGSPKKKARKAVKPKKAAKKLPKAKKAIGAVAHFYSNISVAIVKFSKEIKLGNAIRFKGATTDFVHKISEMQYDHKPIAKSKKGKEVGIRVKDRVREGDKVFEEV